MKKLARSIKVIIAASVILFSTAALSAEPGQNSENETISQLAQEFAFTGETANHDPFKPIVVKKVADVIKIEKLRKTELISETRPKKEVIPPLRMQVTGICGNNGLRQAIVQFENDEHIVETGQVIDGKFKVVEVSPDKLVVYSIKEARRATFNLESKN